MRRLVVSLFCVAVLMPFFAFAATSTVPAGFAPTSIFASKTSITAGDSISLFSVLYNSSAGELTCDVVFTIDGKSIGTKHISLAAGETQTPSVSWTAVTGSHTASAHLENVVSASGKDATISNEKADTITLTVAPPPPPPPPSATTQAVNTVSDVIASSTPVVVNAAEKVFAFSESVRNGAVEALKKRLAASGGANGQVLAASTFKAPQGGTTSPDENNASVLDTLWRGLLGGLLFICNLTWLFYGLLLFVIFALYKLLRTWMRER